MKSINSRKLLPLWVSIIVLNSSVQADTKSYVEYTYDKAGNIVGILSVDANAPPVISELDPNEIRAGRPTSIIARGTGLFKAEISSNSSNLTIRNPSSSIRQAVFDLTAAPGTPLGNYLLTYWILMAVAAMLRFPVAVGPAVSTADVVALGGRRLLLIPMAATAALAAFVWKRKTCAAAPRPIQPTAIRLRIRCSYPNYPPC